VALVLVAKQVNRIPSDIETTRLAQLSNRCRVRIRMRRLRQ
jgi:hypothetical protein